MSTLYSPSIVTDGLVLHFDVANKKSYPGSGSSIYDRSGNGNTGTINGAVFDASTKSISFDGTDDDITVSNHSSLNPSYNTLIVWAKSDSANWSNYGFLISKRDVFVMHPSQYSKTVNFYYYLNGYWQQTSSAPSDIQQWNMYVQSWDGTSIKCYINGEFKTSNSTPSGTLPTTDTGNMTIGLDDGNSGRRLDGDIAIAQMYNRALSDDEVLQNFNATKSRFGL